MEQCVDTVPNVGPDRGAAIGTRDRFTDLPSLNCTLKGGSMLTLLCLRRGSKHPVYIF